MYVPDENRLGIPPIAYVNVPNTLLQSGQSALANQSIPLGTIIRAHDPIYGGGEFIYLQMVASTVVGSWVTYGSYGTTTPDAGTVSEAEFLSVLLANTANLNAPVAVAMAAYPSGTAPTYALGWFQIQGVAIAADNATMTGAPNPVYTVGSGQVTSSAGNGKQVLNARAITTDGTPIAGQFLCLLDRPFMQGQTV